MPYSISDYPIRNFECYSLSYNASCAAARRGSLTSLADGITKDKAGIDEKEFNYFNTGAPLDYCVNDD